VFTKHVHKLKQCTNLILHDENYTFFVVSLLVHKMRGRGGSAYSRGALILNFGPWQGRLFEGGGSYLRIYGTSKSENEMF